MATEAQITANRINAQKSTGPRTAEGKAAVSQNAVTHGLLAAQAVVRGESVEEFTAHRDGVLADLRPVGALESILAERVASLMWRLRRAERLQNEAFEAMYRHEAVGGCAKMMRQSMVNVQLGAPSEIDPNELIAGQAICSDFGSDRKLERLGLYERRIERSLYRTMAELRRIQEIRQAQEAAEDGEGEKEHGQKDRKVRPQPARPHSPMLPRGLRTHPTFEGHAGASRCEDQTEAVVGGLNG